MTFRPWLTLIVVPALAVLVGLGVWQLQRREWKHALVARIDCPLVDLRGQRDQRPELYEANDYAMAQAFGVALRWPKIAEGANGIAYESVRRNEGVNFCVYKPSLIKLPVNQAHHYEYRWDARGEVRVLKITNIEQGPAS